LRKIKFSKDRLEEKKLLLEIEKIKSETAKNRSEIQKNLSTVKKDEFEIEMRLLEAKDHRGIISTFLGSAVVVLLALVKLDLHYLFIQADLYVIVVLFGSVAIRTLKKNKEIKKLTLKYKQEDIRQRSKIMSLLAIATPIILGIMTVVAVYWEDIQYLIKE
jgi:Ca2+/Na+ antiporter